MNRRIGNLLRIGLLAALPIAWSGIALAQTIVTDPPPSIANDQRATDRLDDQTPAPVGTSGSSGVSSGAAGVGSEFNGSAGAVDRDFDNTVGSHKELGTPDKDLTLPDTGLK